MAEMEENKNQAIGQTLLKKRVSDRMDCVTTVVILFKKSAERKVPLIRCSTNTPDDCCSRVDFLEMHSCLHDHST